MSEELSLECVTCSEQFPFSVEEQAFYAEKGFEPPKRCKPCRQAAKQSRRSGQRTMHDVVCASCGVNSQVPFEPREDKPVYCRDCYKNSSSSY